MIVLNRKLIFLVSIRDFPFHFLQILLVDSCKWFLEGLHWCMIKLYVVDKFLVSFSLIWPLLFVPYFDVPQVKMFRQYRFPGVGYNPLPRGVPYAFLCHLHYTWFSEPICIWWFGGRLTKVQAPLLSKMLISDLIASFDSLLFVPWRAFCTVSWLSLLAIENPTNSLLLVWYNFFGRPRWPVLIILGLPCPLLLCLGVGTSTFMSSSSALKKPSIIKL